MTAFILSMIYILFAKIHNKIGTTKIIIRFYFAGLLFPIFLRIFAHQTDKIITKKH